MVWWTYLTTHAYVVGLAVLLIALSSIDTVMSVRLAQQMAFYSFAINQIVYPFIFVALCWPVVGVRLLNALRTPNPRNIPLSVLAGLHAPGKSLRTMIPKFIVVSMLDGITILLRYLPTLYMDSELQVLLSQIGLPATLAFSWFYLGRRYRLTHYLGVITVILGVCVALIPSMDELAKGPPNAFVVWVIMMMVSTIPGAFSKVYQERWLYRYQLDPIYFLAWTALFQTLWSVMMLMIPLIPIPAPAPYVPINKFGDLVVDSFACFFGNTDVSSAAHINASYTAGSQLANALHGASCTDPAPATIFVIFIMSNVVLNAVFVAFIKAATANLTTITNVLRIGVSAILFTWEWMAGASARSLTRHIVLSLFVEATGVFTFKSRKELELASSPASGKYQAGKDSLELGDFGFDVSDSERSAAGVNLEMSDED